MNNLVPGTVPLQAVNQPTVYLAGPIAGLSYGAATDWRDNVITDLAVHGIKGLSPMRAKEYLADVQRFSPHDEGVDLDIMSGSRSIMRRDHFDATRCDMLLVNFLGATERSLGTAMEIAWAWDHQTPIVCAMEAGNPHEHMMIAEAIDWRVNSLAEALHVIKSVLL